MRRKISNLCKALNFSVGLNKIFGSKSDIEKAFGAFKKSIKGKNIKYAIGGGLALAFHGYIRATKDIDIFLPDNKNVNSFNNSIERKFKHVSGNNYLYINSDVELDTITPDSQRLVPGDVIKEAIKNSIESDGVKFLDLKGLIEIKLYSWRLRDRADIEELMKINGEDKIYKMFEGDKELLKKLKEI